MKWHKVMSSGIRTQDLVIRLGLLTTWPPGCFWSISIKVVRLSWELVIPGSAVRQTTKCSMEPGMEEKKFFFFSWQPFLSRAMHLLCVHALMFLIWTYGTGCIHKAYEHETICILNLWPWRKNVCTSNSVFRENRCPPPNFQFFYSCDLDN